MERERLADVILRCGLAFAFLFPAADAFFNPTAWLGYFPGFLRGVVPDIVLLHAFGAVEIILALWLLSGWRVFYPAVLMTLMLLSIAVFLSYDFEILFRDLSIAAIGMALAIKHYPRQNTA